MLNGFLSWCVFFTLFFFDRPLVALFENQNIPAKKSKFDMIEELDPTGPDPIQPERNRPTCLWGSAEEK